MQVAICVNFEDVGEAGSQTQVLEETGEHVPRITLRRPVSEGDVGHDRVALTYRNDADIWMLYVATMAAINAQAGGLKNMAIISPVVLCCDSLGIACDEGINDHSWSIF